MKKHTWMIIILVLILITASTIIIRNGKQKELIGGQRDEYGCLLAAGYTWNETLEVCLREWEIQGDDRQILEYAMNHTSKEYGLTVVNISQSICEEKECFIVEYDILGREKTIDVFADSKTYCSEEQRGPGVHCIQVWEPVCGFGEFGNKTFSNSCMACLNESVLSYVEGEC